MAPKRPSNGSSNGSSRPAKKGKSSDDLSDMVEREKDVIATMPFWDTLMKAMDDMFTNYGSVSEFFMQKYPTLDDRKDLSQKLMENFPHVEPLSPCDWTPGVKNIALWQLCFHLEAGNKGLVVHDFMKSLVQLILIQGPRTCAQTQAGVEFMVIQPLIPCYFPEEWQTAKLVDDTFDCQSVGFTKGWTRSLASLYAAHLILEFDLIEHYQKELPKSFANFCTIKGMVTGEYASEIDRITANRGALPKIISSIVFSW